MNNLELKKVHHWNNEEAKYEVYQDGELIGIVESSTRTSSDIAHSNYRKDIRGVKEWGNARPGQSVIYHTYRTRKQAINNLI